MENVSKLYILLCVMASFGTDNQSEHLLQLIYYYWSTLSLSKQNWVNWEISVNMWILSY